MRREHRLRKSPLASWKEAVDQKLHCAGLNFILGKGEGGPWGRNGRGCTEGQGRELNQYMF